jgi:hypothetical protein
MLAFLQHVPDRARAEDAFGRIGSRIIADGPVTLERDAPGEIHGPLDFAPLPASMARLLFDRATIDDHLSHLARAQRDDGGWTFNWQAWSALAEMEWRGCVTVDSLVVLQANGRI